MNSRGPGLINVANELRLAGFGEEAAAVDHIRNEVNWSWYATELIKRAIQVAESRGVLGILKILLYPKPLQKEHVAELKKFNRGTVRPAASTVSRNMALGRTGAR